MKDTQLALIEGKALTESDVMSAIDGVIETLHQTGNIQDATKVLNILDRIDNVTGHAKAKLLYGMEIWWRKNKKDDDFGDYVESTSGTKRITVLRYLNVQEFIEQEYIPRNIQTRAMRDLVPISLMLSQGYEPTKKDWDRIHMSANSYELREILRTIKGKKPRKSMRENELRRDGTIYTRKGDDKPKYVGFLDVEEAKTDPDVAESINQIIHGKPLTVK